MRSPWKGGSSSLRSRRCSAPSSSSTERGPTTGPSTALASPARSPSGEPAEDLLGDVRVEHHHEAGVEQAPEGHHVAVAAAAGVDEARRLEDEAGRLQPAREPRAGRQPGGGGAVHRHHLARVHGAADRGREDRGRDQHRHRAAGQRGRCDQQAPNASASITPAAMRQSSPTMKSHQKRANADDEAHHATAAGARRASTRTAPHERPPRGRGQHQSDVAAGPLRARRRPRRRRPAPRRPRRCRSC